MEQRRLAPAGVRDDLDLRPRAGLERPRAEQREAAVAVVEQRAAAAEQGPVEIEVGGARGTRLVCTVVVVVRDIEPWDELLEAGRTDERLVTQSAVNARPGREAPIPDELHPEVADALRARGHRAAVVAPGRGDPRGVGRADDRHHRHGVGQVAVLPAPDARRPVLATRAPARSTSTRRRRSPRTRRARSTRSASTARGPRSTTATRRASSARRSGATRNVVLTNPDMLHLGILPNHPAWANFFSNLAVVVVDEAHVYRGVFGSHVGNVLRRLRRIAGAYGTEPRFLLASATIANPGELAERLTGLEDFTVIERDGSPVDEAHDRDVEPADHRREARHAPLRARRGGRPARRAGRPGRAHDRLHEVAQGGRADGEVHPARARGPRPPEARGADRALPRRLHAAAAPRAGAHGSSRASCSASSPPTRSSSASTSARSTPRSASRSPAPSPRLRQQWGRAGRRGRGLAVYIAGEDALDQFFCRHPDEFLDRPVEAAILDHENEQIHAAHLLCAAHEGPLEPPTTARPRPRLAGDRRAARARRRAARAPGRPRTCRAAPRSSRRRACRCARPAATASRSSTPTRASCSGRSTPRARSRRRTRARSTSTAGARSRSPSSTSTQRRALVAPVRRRLVHAAQDGDRHPDRARCSTAARRWA